MAKKKVAKPAAEKTAAPKAKKPRRKKAEIPKRIIRCGISEESLKTLRGKLWGTTMSLAEAAPDVENRDQLREDLEDSELIQCGSCHVWKDKQQYEALHGTEFCTDCLDKQVDEEPKSDDED